MEVPKNKNYPRIFGRYLARGAGLLALATSLYAGDRQQYDGDIWVQQERVLGSQPASTGRVVAQQQETPLTVATYNIKYGSIDREGVIDTARSLGATVLGLTEAGPGISRAIAGDDYEVVVGRTGNVLLSKLPVLEHFSIQLPKSTDEGARSALFAKVDMGQRNAWFVVTHLSNDTWPRSSEATRLQQLAQLQDVMAEQTGGPKIVIGDFNFEPDSAGYEYMDQNFNDGLAELGLTRLETFYGGMGLKRLDYMFLEHGSGYEVVAAGRSASDASDHMPISMVLFPIPYGTPPNNSLPAVLE